VTCPHVEQVALARLDAAEWHAFYLLAVSMLDADQRAELVAIIQRRRDQAAMLEMVHDIRSLPEVEQ
jgi:hypothetical protein